MRNENPNPIDLHVGGRIRLRRKLMGMSQEQLAGCIGLTFQQLQKYERASNRVSASKLYQIAEALKAPVAYFYEGYGEGPIIEQAPTSTEQAVNDFLSTPEGIEVAQSFPLIRNHATRRRIAALITTLAEASCTLPAMIDASANLDDIALGHIVPGAPIRMNH